MTIGIRLSCFYIKAPQVILNSFQDLTEDMGQSRRSKKSVKGSQ